MFRKIYSAIIGSMLISSAIAEDTVKRIQFEPGKSEAVISGKVTGYDMVVYKLNAKDGQFLKVSLHPDKKTAGYNIYIPGRGPGDDALYNSDLGGTYDYTGQLYKTGDHSISVFINRAAARRGESSNYKLHVRITDKAPGAHEEKPATGPVPQKVIDDCIKKLREGVGHETGMKVIRAERGENSFIIDVKVDTAEKPWRCFHDGTKCTQVMYLGEG